MRRRATLAFVAVVSACVPAASAGSPPSDVVAIEHARIVTVSGPVIDKGTILIRAGKIAAVGASVDVPSNARHIDATGLSVFPGLIDSSTTLGLIEIASISASDDTSELGELKPQLRAYDAYNPNSELIREARCNGVTTVVSAPRGGTMAGQALLADLYGVTIEEVAVRPSIGLGLDFPTGVGGRSFDFATFSVKQSSDADARKAQEKKLDEIRDLFDQARAYGKAVAARQASTSLPPLEHDLKLEAMQSVLDGKLPLLVSADDFRDVKKAVEFCDEQKARMILVTSGRFGSTDAATAASFLATHKISVVLGPMYQLPASEDDHYDRPQEVPAALARAHVSFAFATFDSAEVRDLPYQAAMAVAYGGLSKEDALKAVTLWPAQIWGVSDRIGSIEAGKSANLVVTTGDPMEPRTDVKYVFIEGRAIPLTSHQQELYEQFRER